MEGDPVNIGDKIGRCYMETKPRLWMAWWRKSLKEMESLVRQDSRLRPLAMWSTDWRAHEYRQGELHRGEGDLDQLRESCSIPSSIQIWLPKKGETIMSACPSELIPNAWQNVVYAVVLWRFHKLALSLIEFRTYLVFTRIRSQTLNGCISRQGRRGPYLGIKGRELYSIKVVLGSKTFCRSFDLSFRSMASNGGDNDEDVPIGRATSVAGDEGESHHSRDEPRQGSSSSSSEAWFDPWLLSKLRSDVMSKKISLKKLAQLTEGYKGASPVVMSTSAAKWISISEKHTRGEVPDITPTKKGKLASDAKGKGTRSPPDVKKKATWRFKTSLSKATTKSAIVVAAVEGTSVNPVAVLGPQASILNNLGVVEKLIEGVIPPLDKAAVNKLELDQPIMRLFQGIGEMRDEAMIQQGRVASIESKMTHAQKLALNLEGQLAELKTQEQQAIEELKKMTKDQNAT
ncbi:hypothetical protein Acr_23g0010890 [Actinidia rufa]|uniref:Uncharacterized protein n=1 Tax=Actinidia rufa TaxID=165716 RepID=A0A7J0GQ10_9ERIC|nr:hypothetical protein Acr_23g0010890 [Actinidia rufa]